MYTEAATDSVGAHEYLRKLLWVLEIDSPDGESFSVKLPYEGEFR